jgi:ADP-ribosylglycohydrolase
MKDSMIENIFLGIAIGDAYGAGLEFQDRNWIRQHVDFTTFINRRTDINTPKKEIFTIDYHEWDYTDDMEMSIAVAKAIMSNAPFEENMLVQHFLDEYNLGYAVKGYKRNGHGAIKAYYAGEKTIEEIRQFQQYREYPGNAPPMRAIPIGLLNTEKIIEYATINANATHPHPKAIASSILVAKATEALLIKSIAPINIIEYCSAYINEEETLGLLKLVDELPEYSLLVTKHYELLCGKQPINEKSFLSNVNGLPSNAMYTAIAALYILKHATTAFEALKFSIYLGGDVDSLAAICVGIAAGKYGINSLPKYMIDNVEGKDYIKDVATHFKLYLNKEK